MPRTKSSNNKPQVANVKEFTCAGCGEVKPSRDYYVSYNPIHKTNIVPYCKSCLQLMSVDENGNINLDKFKEMLKMVDRPFLKMYWEIALEDTTMSTFGSYWKSLQMKQNRYLTWKDSDDVEYFKSQENSFIKNSNITESEEDKRNREDVIRMVGYDPFENENSSDKKYLYNSLVDFLDESTLEDSFKLPVVIEIVKSFNQLDKINQALSIMTADINNIANQSGGIKSLFDSKQKIYASVLAMAKDNGISVNHNNSKSKGAGTLSGIIKKLQELGFTESDINLFNIETCEGIKQVADISNKSILQQLMFDENEYTEMIKEQRILIEDYRNKYQKLEEENRILKLQLSEVKVGEN